MKRLTLIFALSLSAPLLFTSASLAQTRARPAQKPVAAPTPVPPAHMRKVTARMRSGDPVSGNFIKAEGDSVLLDVVGNKVTLKLDDVASLVFADEPNTPPPAAVPATATLLIEAGIIYKMGGNQPVARTEFYLLDDDAEKIIVAAGFPPDAQIGTLASYAIKSRYGDTGPAAAATEAIKGHVKFSATTDFGGKGQFSDIPPGRYYLYGRAGTRKGFAIWNVPVDIKPGQNSIALDQNNAAAAF